MMASIFGAFLGTMRFILTLLCVLGALLCGYGSFVALMENKQKMAIVLFICFTIEVFLLHWLGVLK